MKISVIIPTYNRASKLKECLNHLEHQTLNFDQFEVLVVSDGSTDTTNTFLEHYKKNTPLEFNFFVQQNSGQGVARNLGIQNATNDVILFIGDDIYAAPTLLAEHQKTHKNHSEESSACLGFVTWDPRQKITPLMTFVEKGGALFGRWGGGQFAYDLLRKKQKADWHFFYTANISLKKSLLLRHHFDESFKGYGWEDIDLGLRLTEEERLELFYNSDAIALHDHPQTLESFVKREYSVGKALPLFQAKHPHHKFLPSPYKKLIFSLLSIMPFRALCKIFWRDMYYYATAKKHFLRGLSEGILQMK